MTVRKARALVLVGTSALAAALTAAWYLGPLVVPASPSVLPAAGPATYSAVGESVTFTFLTSSRAWAAASISRDRIYIYGTADGARSWRPVGAITGPPSTEVAQFRFFDPAQGIIVLGGKTLAAYLTADAGRHWSSVPLPEPQTESLDFVDPLHGWASGLDGELYETANGGTGWLALSSPLAAGAAPVFATASEGWLGGPAGAGTVYRTRDGGENWQAVRLPPPGACSGTPSACAPAGDREAGPQMASADVINVLGADAVVVWDMSIDAGYVSLDSGASWRTVTPPADIFDISETRFQDATHWWLIDSNVLYKTRDAGQTWSVASDHVVYDKLEPNIVDRLHAWCALQVTSDTRLGARPESVWELNLTSDGGLHWTQGTVPVPV